MKPLQQLADRVRTVIDTHPHGGALDADLCDLAALLDRVAERSTWLEAVAQDSQELRIGEHRFTVGQNRAYRLADAINAELRIVASTAEAAIAERDAAMGVAENLRVDCVGSDSIRNELNKLLFLLSGSTSKSHAIDQIMLAFEHVKRVKERLDALQNAVDEAARVIRTQHTPHGACFHAMQVLSAHETPSRRFAAQPDAANPPAIPDGSRPTVSTYELVSRLAELLHGDAVAASDFGRTDALGAIIADARQGGSQ